MKEEYDFSNGERGKFYREEVSLKMPIYLNAENLTFIQSVAEKNNSDLSTVVNDLIKKSHDMENV
jgi:hypothetical protein